MVQFFFFFFGGGVFPLFYSVALAFVARLLHTCVALEDGNNALVITMSSAGVIT